MGKRKKKQLDKRILDHVVGGIEVGHAGAHPVDVPAGPQFSHAPVLPAVHSPPSDVFAHESAPQLGKAIALPEAPKAGPVERESRDLRVQRSSVEAARSVMQTAKGNIDSIDRQFIGHDQNLTAAYDSYNRLATRLNDIESQPVSWYQFPTRISNYFEKRGLARSMQAVEKQTKDILSAQQATFTTRNSELQKYQSAKARFDDSFSSLKTSLDSARESGQDVSEHFDYVRQLSQDISMQRVRDKKERQVNAGVTVDNIHARSLSHVGEFKEGRADALSRVKKTIDRLGQIANDYHTQKNFETTEEGSKLKQGRENNITRLVTDEFAFYTKDKPLEPKEFDEIISHVEQMASKLKPNLTLVLSSFPVLGPDGLVHNTVIHVQGGPDPKLTFFAKTTQSGIDPVYSTHKTADLYGSRKSGAAPAILVSPEAGAVMPRNSVIKVTTAGGAQYFDALDICLDHAYGVARANLDKAVRDAATEGPLAVVPDQIAHIVSSSSIEINPAQSIGRQILHADPYVAFASPEQSKLHQTISEQHLQAIRNQISFDSGDRMRVAPNRAGVQLTGPEWFGPGMELSFLAPQKLDRMPVAFLKAANAATQPSGQ